MAERGTVTATIVSTRLSGDDARSARVEPRLPDVVLRHGGRLVTPGGAGVTAVFEAASSAVRAAMAMHVLVRRLAPELSGHAGVAAGDVTWEDDDCFGAPVVTAARLQAAAGAGQILVSHAVRLLAGDRAGDRYEHVGLLELPGLAEPVDAYLAGWDDPDGDERPAVAVPPPMPLALGATGTHPFVGRAAAMAELHRAWLAARGASGRILLIGGEAGAGKTRLAIELARRVHADGAAVLYGGCDEELALPYQPWVQALDHVLPALPAASVVERLGPRLAPLAQLLARVERLVTGDRPSPAADPEAERYRLYDAFIAVLGETAVLWPTLVVLDDLHWAGTQTLALLRHLAHVGIPSGLLVVGTFRDTGDEVTEPLAGCLADLRRVDGTTRVRLAGLDADAVERFVAAATGQALDDDMRRLAAGVADRSGGNVFYLGELWRHLVSTGAVVRVDGRWVVRGSAATTNVPDGVREVVAARLGRLTPAARRLADVAALAGQRIDLQVLALAADLAPGELERPVSELVGAGLLAEVSTTALVYHFAHALVRDTVEEAISPLARGRLHLAVGRAIETVYEADRRPVLAELARHFAAAAPLGAVDKAVYYGRRAAAQASRSGAYDEAITHLGTVLELVPVSVQRAEVLVDLGAAQLRRGYYAAACAACADAFRLATDLGAVDVAAEAAVAFETARHFPGFPGGPAASLLREALELVGDSSAPLQTRLLASLGRALAHSGRTTEGVETAERAVSLARAMGDPDSLTVALQAMLTSVDEPTTLLAAAGELADLAEQLGDAWSANYATCNHFRAYVALGRMDEAAQAVEHLGGVSTRGRFSMYMFMTKSFEVVLALAAGDFERAEEAAERAFGSEQTPFQAGVYGMQMFAIRRAQGRLSEVAPVVRLLVADPDPPPIWRPGLAALYVELGQLDDARAVYESLAPDRFAAVARDSMWPACLTFLAETCIALGDIERATLLYNELTVYRERNLMVGFTICLGPADRLLGDLAALLGRTELADVHFAAALELAERCRSPLWTAEVQYDWSIVLHGRGDETGAAGVRRQALTTARLIGMGRLTNRPEPVLSSVRVAPARPDGMSARELEVLGCVVDGLSNREIGERLFISQNTVANHVRAILQKTGCANRTEAASYAVRAGLAGQSSSS